MLNKIYEYFKEKLLIPTIIVLSAIVTLVSFIALVLTIAPIEVLSKWTLSTDKMEYRLGETVNIKSVGNKRFDLPGDSERTLVCITSTRTNTYPLNSSFNTNVSKGEFDLDIPVTLPTALELVPRTCRIDIDVDYPLYGFKSSGSTNNFLIKE